MTRITYGTYKAGVREPTLTLSGLSQRFMGPTPFSIAGAAIARYYRETPERAARHLDRTLSSSTYWGAEGTPQAGWADAIRECFETYREMAQDDDRPAFATGLNRDLEVGPNSLAVHIDVILLDPDGYVPRIVLWDKGDLTQARARMYAAPVLRVVEKEMGAGRVPIVEVWHLRSGADAQIPQVDADDAFPEVAPTVQRMVSGA